MKSNLLSLDWNPYQVSDTKDMNDVDIMILQYLVMNSLVTWWIAKVVEL